MTDKPDESAADNAADSADEAGAIPPPPPPPPPPTTDPIAQPVTTPLAGHHAPPVAQPPKTNWWREHVWTTVIGASLLTGIAGLGVGFAIGFFCTNGPDLDDDYYGPGHHHGRYWDDRGRDHRWGDDRGDRYGDRDRDDWGRGYWDDRGSRGGPQGRGSEVPPWMRAPRQTAPAPGAPTPGAPAPGAPAPGAPAPGQPQPTA